MSDKLKLKLEINKNLDGSPRYDLLTVRNREVARGLNGSDARSIAKLVNHHAELVEALRLMYEVANFELWDDSLTGKNLAIKQAREVLEKLEREE